MPLGMSLKIPSLDVDETVAKCAIGGLAVVAGLSWIASSNAKAAKIAEIKAAGGMVSTQFHKAGAVLQRVPVDEELIFDTSYEQTFQIDMCTHAVLKPFMKLKHSCDPCALIVPSNDLKSVSLVALRKIRAGQQLTVDYEHTEDRMHSPIIGCKCGAKKCRKYILGRAVSHYCNVQNAKLDNAVVRLQKDGLVNLEHLFTGKDIEFFKKVSSDRISELKELLKTKPITMTGDFIYSDIVHQQKNRYDISLRHNTELRDRIQKHPLISRIIYAMMGQQMEACQVGTILTGPGSPPQWWHRDSFLRFKGRLHKGEAYFLTMIIPLVPITPEMGGTEFILGSHLRDDFVIDPSFTRGAEILDETGLVKEVPLVPDIGGAYLFDGRIVHRGLPNVSGKQRPILYVTFEHHLYDADYLTEKTAKPKYFTNKA